MTQVTKSQHYVPQMYLREFEAKPKHVFVYDKEMDLKSATNCNCRAIKALAAALHFYDLPTTLKPENVEQFQVIEKELSRIEGVAAGFIRGVNKGCMKLRGTAFDPTTYSRPEIRVYENLAAYTWLQYARTISGREVIRQAMDLMAKIEIAEAVSEVAPDRDPNDFKYQLNEHWVKYHHIEAMFDFETFVPLFYKRIWRLGINSTDVPFWTSDNPVVLIDQDGESKDVFLADRGSCITFPLSPFVVLLMYDDKVFKDMAKLDGKPMNVPSNFVDILNRAQFAQSRRIVMSAKPFDKQLLRQLTNNVSVD